jgi:hypothetical protein
LRSLLQVFNRHDQTVSQRQPRNGIAASKLPSGRSGRLSLRKTR